MAGIRAGRSCLLTSQRLLRCVSGHSTGDPTGVYPHFPNCQLPSSLPPPVPQPGPLLPLSLTWIILQIWEAGVVAFSSGNGGPLHPAFPPLLSASLPHASPCWTGQADNEDAQGLLCVFPSLPVCLVVALAAAHTHGTWKQAPGDLDGARCGPNCSLGGLGRASQVHWASVF